MKPLAAKISLQFKMHPSGLIEGLVTGAAPGLQLGLLLDGTLHAVVTPESAEAGTHRFTCTLPSHLLFQELDILSLPGGFTLLPKPVALAPFYDVQWGAVAVKRRSVSGSFTAAPHLAAELGIAWHDAAQRAAIGVARRKAGTNSWHFALPLLTLLRPGARLTLLPQLGGLGFAGPTINITPDTAGFLGCLDTASPERVTGWAFNSAAPKRRVRLDILLDGQHAATVTAGDFRADLLALGLGNGHCGFAADLPPQSNGGAHSVIDVRLHNETTSLAGSPHALDAAPPPGMAGFLDNVHGMAANGWALDFANPQTPVTVEVIGPDSEVLGSGLASLFRGDLLDAGFNEGHCAFKVDLSSHFERLLDHEVSARIAGTSVILSGSPQRVTANANIQLLLHRKQSLRAGVLARLRRTLNYRAGDGGISFIMGVHNTPRAWLIEALESVRAQYCDAWELICIDDASTAPHVHDILANYAARDSRVRVLRPPENVGIARAVNFALRVAKYPYVSFIDHDDKIEPDAAWQLIRAAQMTNADLLYSDEAQCGDNIEAINELRLRPAFSHDYYLSHPYFVHLVCARTDLARQIGGYDETMAISADVDFVLRMIEVSRIITHVPAVLYRWRTHAASSGHAKQSSVMAASIAALQRHLDRLGTGARVHEGVWFNQFRIDWPDATGKILIVIPTKNRADLLRTAIDSIERTAMGADYRLVVIDHESDDPASIAYLQSLPQRHVVMRYTGPFNFSRMNNMAVAKYGDDCGFVLFLNNDIEATQDGWLQRMRNIAARNDVGAVGALLMYANKTVQHAGVVFGFNNSADHALKFQNVFLNTEGRRNLGYNCAMTSVRDYSAVTAACLMMRKSVFDEITGFDETYAIGFNDTDLCLRITGAGYRILYDGHTILFHYESATRAKTKQVFHPEDTAHMISQWGNALTAGDPYYNPNLSLTVQDHVPREEPGCTIINLPRMTAVRLDRIKQKDILF